MRPAGFFKHSREKPPVRYVKQSPVMALAANSRNRAFAKEFQLTSHQMSKLRQRAVIGFFILKGLRPQQIHPELSDVYHEQALQLPAVEKRHLRFADMACV
jgi:hypothetical protein